VLFSNNINNFKNNNMMKNLVKISLLMLRIFVGWHFLYEGLIKLVQGDWSSEAYLKGSIGFLSGFYHWMASDPGVVQVIDFINIWGLILLGAGLFLGIFIRISSVSGIILLALYYFAYPPFGSAYSGLNLDGHYWIINNQLIEIIALSIILKFPLREFGLLKFIPFKFANKVDKPEMPEEVTSNPEEVSVNMTRRRELLKGLAALPLFGGMLIGAVARAKSMNPDAISGSTIALKKIDLTDLKGELPRGKIADLEIGRLIMGNNLVTGVAHARDLHYARQLVRQYNTEEKLFETFSIADQAGINMTTMGLGSFRCFDRYKKITGSKMMTNFQINVDLKGNDRLSFFKQAMDYGATMMYVHGSSGDSLTENGQLDLIREAVEYVQSQGYPAGIGGHSIQVVIACEKAGIKPDYYFKSMHQDNYWSAHPREFRQEFEVAGKSPDHNHSHDNIWDIFPEQTVEVISKVNVPVIGFKVLAAGAITPEDGFRYAFESGADFICVGMFDYQVVEDVNLVTEILNSDLNRSRPWYS
jgi:uncharacterized membrane protein YphA (DoxX/SURF4 family)